MSSESTRIRSPHSRYNPTAWLTRASLSHVRDESEQALSEYAKVIELDPDNVEARLARLGLLLDLGRDRDTDSEFEYFDKDVKKKVDPRLAYLAAIKLSRAGKGKEAAAKLTDAGNTLEVLGHEIVYHNVQLLMVAGIVNFTLGKDEVARAYLEEYLKLAKGDLITRKMLATILLKQRDFGRASKLLEQASEHFGETPELLALLARAYTGAGNEARATAVLQRAVQLQPANSRLATELALSRALGANGNRLKRFIYCIHARQFWRSGRHAAGNSLSQSALVQRSRRRQ